MLFAFVVSANLFAASPRYYGDINQDGKVDIADISALVEILNGKSSSSYDLLLANVDAKGDIDTADLDLLVEYVLGIKPLVEYVDFNGMIYVKYNGNTATVENLPADGSITATIDGADVTINNTITDKEITAVLSGKSTSGSYVYVGAYKTTMQLNGLTLKGSSAEAINVKNGKRNNLVLVDGTTNTIEDASTDGGQKAAIYSKGHFEISGAGTLNLVGNIKHALSAKEYIMLKKSTGTINVTSAASDGIHAGQYIKINGGTVTINGVASDGIQAEASGAVDYDEDEDDGSLIITGGTLNVTISGDDADAIKCDDLLSISNSPTITITTSGSGAKGLKTNGDVCISGGTLNFTQSGGYIATMVGSEIDDSYSTSIKADKDINITGGSITIDNKANGGKGLSADGNIVINSETATLDITANGAGGTLETNGTSTPTEAPKSYKVYVAIPTSSNQGGMGGRPGGSSSNAWTKIYLYKSDGTLVTTLTNSVSKTSGSTTKTFYYYDFGASDSGTYYFKSDNYSSSSRPGSSSTSYTIKSGTFTGPTSGEDYYYEISNSYSTNGTTRTYSLSNVTNTWNGSTSDASEDSGESYAASGIKADGNITISAGTLTIKNPGEMSKSIKSKSTVTIDGGDITLTPSGAMKVINSDASYSTGVKAVDFVQNGGKLSITASGAASRGISATNVNTNGGTIDITNSGAGQSGTNDSYTAKGIKADTNIALNAGTITINMSGAGGKGIKSSGTYTQGTSDGEGPTLTVNTTGSSFGSSSSSSGGQFGGGPGGGGMQESSGSSAKAIKVQGAATIYGGTSEISTKTDGAEGLESKTSIDIRGGKHYFNCYDDCINCSGMISFNGGLSVCYATNNDAVDSNYGRTGAITIGNGTVFAYTTAGSPEEGLDCDNNSYIVITGTGTAISAGGTQGGGGGGWGGSSSSSSIGSSTQGYYLSTSTLSYKTNTYYTLADASGNNLITYSFEGACSSTLSLFTAKGMTSGSSYTVKSSTSAPTDATTAWHGVYLGSSASGSTSLTSFTAIK